MADVFTSVGEAYVTDLMDGTITGAPANYYIGWGTGTGTAAKGDTVLFTEAAEARVAPTTEDQPSADQNRWIGTLTSSSSQTITNAGLFNASTAGTLIIHGDHTGVPLNNGDKIEYTITLQWS